MGSLAKYSAMAVDGFGRLVAFVRALRFEDVKERATTLWAARAQLGWQRIAIIGAVVLLLGGIVATSLRNAATMSGEPEFEYPIVCANCGWSSSLSPKAAFREVAAARQRGFPAAGQGTSSPLALCPKCSKLAVFRAAACPKCGKPVPPPFATVNGAAIAPKCRACGWSAKQRGG